MQEGTYKWYERGCKKVITDGMYGDARRYLQMVCTGMQEGTYRWYAQGCWKVLTDGMNRDARRYLQMV